VPVQVGGTTRFRDIVVTSWPGIDLSCGISTEARLYCWGANASVFRGSDGPLSSLLPVPLGVAETFAAVELSGSYGCALGTSGLIHCWGSATAPLGRVVGFGYAPTPTPIVGQLPPP